MNKKAILVFLSAFFQVSIQAADEKDDFYNAAVVEFAPSRVQKTNLEQYEWFIQQAKQAGVDIIVFPERTLHGLDGDIEDKYTEIPDPESKVIPCNNQNYSKWELLESLSCAALDNTIYVVVNILERVSCNRSESKCNRDGLFVYNTNVVFDRTGTVISRYRKFNLHNEPSITTTDEPEFQVFDTDFGVRFGVFTSFDILFKTPAVDLIEKYNVTNFVHPSYWYGELPFNTAIQIQSGWSYAMNVNLLAAGAIRPLTGTGGSGIYVGRIGPPIFSMHECEESMALISAVPKNVRQARGVSPNHFTKTVLTNKKGESSGRKNEFQLQKDPTVMDSKTFVLTDHETELDEEVCSGSSLCCRFRATYRVNPEAVNKHYRYRALAYQGDKTFTEGVTGGVEACAIILCTGPAIWECGRRPEPSYEYIYDFKNIHIEARFSSNQTIQMPNIILGSEVPGRKTKMILMGSGYYDFQTKEEGATRTVTMTLKAGARNIITFGIYSRDFTKNGALTLRHSIFTLIVTLFFVKCFK
ncbi:UNVERIFIED_CONTAM: hypothetical protein PYX00_002244 [Menopon gallinae]|uniref:CN hydrolase domain-containing protein n=1 Tax=Menopon gallinae TaxID=328185 RepID=A0AAW2IHD9_9NEOP